jgi:hypothetical protein
MPHATHSTAGRTHRNAHAAVPLGTHAAETALAAMLACALATCLIAGAVLSGCSAGSGASVSAQEEKTSDEDIPSWVRWNDTELSCDIDGDGSSSERIELADKRLRAFDSAGNCVYETPEDWQVCDVTAGDLTRDGIDDVVFVVWRQGSFGSSHPFWISDDDSVMQEISEHVYVFGWNGTTLAPVWMSSAIDFSVIGARISSEGVLELEGPDGSASHWAWSEWGLDRCDDEETDRTADSAASAGQRLSADAGNSVTDATAATAAAGTAASRNSADKEVVSTTRTSLLAVGDNIAHESIYESPNVRGSSSSDSSGGADSTGASASAGDGDGSNGSDGSSESFDFSSIYEPVSALVSSYDIAAVTQETVLVADPERRSSYPDFATPTSMADALADAGFDVVASATNHANDQGGSAINETLAYWAQNYPDVSVLGIHGSSADYDRIDYRESNGIRLALFDYTYGLNSGHELAADETWRVNLLSDENKLVRDLKTAERTADISVCFLHIGNEYDSEPTQAQRDLVERLADAGADIIICSHAHVLEPFGTIRTAAGNQAVVYYGLGNFVSGQFDEIATIVGGAASIEIEKETLADGSTRTFVASAELIPLVCHTDSDGNASVYPLDEYTDELGTAHIWSRKHRTQLTVDMLKQQVRESALTEPASR